MGRVSPFPLRPSQEHLLGFPLVTRAFFIRLTFQNRNKGTEVLRATVGAHHSWSVTRLGLEAMGHLTVVAPTHHSLSPSPSPGFPAEAHQSTTVSRGWPEDRVTVVVCQMLGFCSGPASHDTGTVSEVSLPHGHTDTFRRHSCGRTAYSPRQPSMSNHMTQQLHSEGAHEMKPQTCDGCSQQHDQGAPGEGSMHMQNAAYTRQGVSIRAQATHEPPKPPSEGCQCQGHTLCDPLRPSRTGKCRAVA